SSWTGLWIANASSPPAANGKPSSAASTASVRIQFASKCVRYAVIAFLIWKRVQHTTTVPEKPRTLTAPSSPRCPVHRYARGVRYGRVLAWIAFVIALPILVGSVLAQIGLVVAVVLDVLAI